MEQLMFCVELKYIACGGKGNMMKRHTPWPLRIWIADQNLKDVLELLISNNKCLLLMHLHNFYNNADLPRVKLIRNAYYYNVVPHAVTVCGSFWWRSIMKLSDYYRQITTCKVGREKQL
jgi:hypothetical protein